MKVTDFAEKQFSYTGAINKRKWVITKPDILETYLKECNYKPSLLKEKLNISYATVKRLLCSAGLWEKVDINPNLQSKNGGRKRSAIFDKFGYKYADKEHDYKNDRGEIVRRFEHHIVAEQKYNRKLNDKEIVHHIDLDKSNNSPENLFICEDNKHHRILHGQLERVAGEAVRCGIIKFHPDHGYYLNNKELIIGD